MNDTPSGIKEWSESRSADLSLITNYLAAISGNILDFSNSMNIVASSISSMSVNSNSMASLTSISDTIMQIRNVAEAACRPSVIYKPDLFKDGDTWMAIYGPTDRVGVAGVGDTPELAMQAFDEAWVKG